MRIEPDKRKDERADTKKKDNDRGCFKIPFRLGFFIQKLSAKAAFDGIILDLFGAKGTLFHSVVIIYATLSRVYMIPKKFLHGAFIDQQPRDHGNTDQKQAADDQHDLEPFHCNHLQ